MGVEKEGSDQAAKLRRELAAAGYIARTEAQRKAREVTDRHYEEGHDDNCGCRHGGDDEAERQRKAREDHEKTERLHAAARHGR